MKSELEKIAYVYGDVVVASKKQRRIRRKLLVIDLLYDYAKNSTLHGLRYIVERGLTIMERITTIMLFFKKDQFVTMRRSELFGVTELLANIGGLLGVFLGFSFLSLIELFYFLTLRVGFALKRDSEEEKLKKMPESNKA